MFTARDAIIFCSNHMTKTLGHAIEPRYVKREEE